MEPVSIPYPLLYTLSQEPELITWSLQREVILQKTADRKLGLKLQTFQGQQQSYTIVTKVKPDCHIVKGHLKVFERVLEVNFEDIVHLPSNAVLPFLARIPGCNIVLKVSSPSGIDHVNALTANSDPGDPGDRPICADQIALSGADVTNSKKSGDIGNESFGSDVNEVEITDDQISNRSVTYSWEKRLQKNSETQLRNVSKGKEPVKRISDDSGVTVLSNVEENEGKTCVTNEVKRADSQVSGSSGSSNQSGKSGYSLCRPRFKNSSLSRCDCSSRNLALFFTLEMMRKNKGDNKHGKQSLLKGGNESVDHAELEPLKPKVCKSPRGTSHCERFVSKDEGSLSLPIQLDSAVSMADINIDDLVTQSLPLPGSQQCSMVGGQVPADLRVCHSCGNQPSVTTRSSPVVTSFFTSQEDMPAEYKEFLLKSPHLAIWDVNTHVVEINRGGAPAFGFQYKVKLGKNNDASVEVYTLVKEVDVSGPAKGKLRVGDWIRSVNGTPIQRPEEPFSLISTGSSQGTLRLVIQRPEGLSQQPKNLPTHRSDNYSHVASSASQPPSPAVRDQDPLLPGIIEPDRPVMKMVTPQNIYFNDVVQSPGDTSSSHPPFPRTVKFPKVRVFLCGTEAEKCASMILGNSEVQCESRESGYSYVEFSMTTDCFGNVVVSKVCSNLYSANGHHSTCHSNGVQCKSCGFDLKTGNMINVEMHVITDDRLFHHCSNYLFTKSSMFILTFDGGKLLETPQMEFSRIQNLAHTVRCYSGEECPLIMFGFLNSSPKKNQTFRDEVQALFYTSHYNTQIEQFNVLGPELISSHCNPANGDKLSECRDVQLLLWKSVTETVQRQHVLQPTLLVVDHLFSVRSEVFMTEERLMILIKTKLPDYQLDVHQGVLIELNQYGEIIIGKATPFFLARSYSVDQHVILNPRVLLTHLHHVTTVITGDKITWSRVHSTGLILQSELSSILKSQVGESQVGVITQFLECVGMLFRKPRNSVNKTGQQDYYIPYFVQVPSCTEFPASGKKDLELYLYFSDHQSTQTLFQLAVMLALASDTSESLSISETNSCSVVHMGIHVTLFHHKLEDKIKFIFRREDKSMKVKPGDLYNWLHSSVSKLEVDHNFVIGPLCPLGPDCQNSPSPGCHIIDLQGCKPEYCGDERVDTRKAVRQWKQDLDSLIESTFNSKTSPRSKPDITTTTVTSAANQSVLGLRWPLFFKIVQLLKINQGWQTLAGEMGYTSEEVAILSCNTKQDPPQELLQDWSRNPANTVQKLVSLLSEIDRKDIIQEIRDFLGEEFNFQQDSLTLGYSSSSLNDAPRTKSGVRNNQVSFEQTGSGDCRVSPHLGKSNQTPLPRVVKVDSTEMLHFNIPVDPLINCGGDWNQGREANENEESELVGSVGEAELSFKGTRLLSNLSGSSEEGAGALRNVGATDVLNERTITPVETTQRCEAHSQKKAAE
ncbi:uncharacterized protein LOC127832254 isoform X2 [Dreissena polymorpha]|nr:uncharacterized protein LOC127832254 isoform X2 [Dreissena polymorpha]